MFSVYSMGALCVANKEASLELQITCSLLKVRSMSMKQLSIDDALMTIQFRFHYILIEYNDTENKNH